MLNKTIHKKLLKTGSYTYMLTLPKEWVKGLKLKAKKKLCVELKSNCIVIKSREVALAEEKKKLKLRRKRARLAKEKRKNIITVSNKKGKPEKVSKPEKKSKNRLHNK